MGENKVLSAQVIKLIIKNSVSLFEVPKELFMIVITGLLLDFDMNCFVFLVLKPMPLLHFTLRVVGKVTHQLHILMNLTCAYS